MFLFCKDKTVFPDTMDLKFLLKHFKRHQGSGITMGYFIATPPESSRSQMNLNAQLNGSIHLTLCEISPRGRGGNRLAAFNILLKAR